MSACGAPPTPAAAAGAEQSARHGGPYRLSRNPANLADALIYGATACSPTGPGRFVSLPLFCR